MNKPIISLVAAMANNRVIGKDNQMPWHLPADLAHFKKVTMSKPIIMGRKTFESIGRPLPGRRNIVVTRQADLVLEGAEVFQSLDDALAATNNVDEVMIIGGGNIYQQALPVATKLYLTFIDLDVEGDTHFPDYTQLELEELSRESHLSDEKNPYPYQFVDYRVIR